MEDNCTAFLVRSTSLKWTRGSVLAVDTGVHLSAIEQLLQQYYPLPPGRPHTLREGVLAGLELPHQNIGANTAHIARNIVGAHLLTHPHLDHISGGVISTALASTRPMIIAGLASTIEALKNHIFNDVIWPNLSDENGGVGLVTFMRLISGGSSVLGDGITQGYMEAVEGLGVKSWAISHGNCIGDFPCMYFLPMFFERSGSRLVLSISRRCQAKISMFLHKSLAIHCMNHTNKKPNLQIRTEALILAPKPPDPPEAPTKDSVLKHALTIPSSPLLTSFPKSRKIST